MKKVRDLATLAEQFSCIILDAYGVFWGQGRPLEGAVDAMRRAVLAGTRLGICSNTSQLAESEIAKLKKHGIELGIHYLFIVTSGQLAYEMCTLGQLPFSAPRKTFYSSSPMEGRYAFQTTIFAKSTLREVKNLDEADFIWLTIPHFGGMDRNDPEEFRPLVEALVQSGKPILCNNPDEFAFEAGSSLPVVRQGALAHMAEKLGARVHIIGKPGKEPFLEAARRCELLGCAGPILMVGDTPATDIRGAKSVGFKTALVTETGLFAYQIQKSSFEEAAASLEARDTPDFFVERLGHV